MDALLAVGIDPAAEGVAPETLAAALTVGAEVTVISSGVAGQYDQNYDKRKSHLCLSFLCQHMT